MMRETMDEHCNSCGRLTEAGMRAQRERSKAAPIYGTDFSKPLSEIVAGIRSDLTKARGRISDVGYAYPGWGERLQAVEGLLTCGIVSLYHTIEELKEYETRLPSASTSPPETPNDQHLG